MATIPAHENEFPSLLLAEGAAPATPAAGLVICYVKADGLLYCKDDAGTETAYAALTDHLADTADAHNASAVSVADAGAVFTGTDVEAVLAELQAAISGGGIPATIFDAQGDLIVASAADTAARLALGASGTVLTSNGTTAAWTAPSAGALIGYGRNSKSSGNTTINGTTWAAFDSGLDITFAATAGDVVECGLVTFSDSGATAGYHDFATIVAGSPVNFFSGSGTGTSGEGIISALTGSNINVAIGAILSYVIVGGDISGGNVTLRWMTRTSGAVNKVYRSDSDSPAHFWAKNYGQ